jgi:hypothetical protein
MRPQAEPPYREHLSRSDKNEVRQTIDRIGDEAACGKDPSRGQARLGLAEAHRVVEVAKKLLKLLFRHEGDPSASMGGSAPTLAPSAATRRSDRASSWRRPLRRPSKSLDLRACNARAVGGGGCVGALPEKRAELFPSGPALSR